MTLVAQTPREVDMCVDAPFYWNPFLPKYERTKFHDEPQFGPSSDDSDVVDDVVDYKQQTSYFDGENITL